MAFDDIENLGRWLYGIACAQRVSGSDEGEDTRRIMLREIDRRIAGAYGFPYTSEYATTLGHEPAPWLWGDRAVLEGWIQCWRSATTEEERGKLAARIEAMVAGLDAFTIKKGACTFFPTYTPGLNWSKPENIPLPADSLGGMIWPLVEWYELSGNETALALAIGIAHTIVQYHPMRSNGVCPMGCFSNNHGVLNAMAGVLACHRHVRNDRHMIWAATLFEYYLNRCSSAFGWVNEYERGVEGYPTQRDAAEGCATIDMVRVGIELGRLGFEYGWEVAERFTRNYLTQAQIKQVTPFNIPDGIVINRVGRTAVDNVPLEQRDSDDIWQRVIGAMAGWGAPNDILDARGRLAMCIQNCCSSHLPIGLMHAWEQTVTQQDGSIRVNMLLTQQGPLARTIDHQPIAGMLEIIPEINGPIAVRMPDWVDETRVCVSVDGQPADISWPEISRYVKIPAVTAGSTVRVEYPLREVILTERLGGTLYTTSWRGDMVTGITPAGHFIPIFTEG
jgi:hypothetical protein